MALLDTNINSDIFYAWLTQNLLPKVPMNAVIVMDNASVHQREDMKTAIQASAAIVEYLPPYSPDLNPIEKKWAQAKAVRKQHRCDDIDPLFSEHVDYIIL